MSETFEHKGLTIRIEPDTDPMNPRKEWDNMSTMVCQHRRYDIGDEQFHCSKYEFWLDKMRDMHPNVPDDLASHHLERWIDKCFTVQTLFLFDHGGLAISTSGFSCPWDSGPVGFIYCSLEEAAENFSVPADWSSPVNWGEGKFITLREAVIKCQDSEVSAYDSYLRGDVWGFVIEDEEGDELDSCWGFFGDDYCLREAKSVVDHLVEHREKVELQRIANGVYDI